MKINKNMQC